MGEIILLGLPNSNAMDALVDVLFYVVLDLGLEILLGRIELGQNLHFQALLWAEFLATH